jgi:hypothetical protein
MKSQTRQAHTRQTREAHTRQTRQAHTRQTRQAHTRQTHTTNNITYPIQNLKVKERSNLNTLISSSKQTLKEAVSYQSIAVSYQSIAVSYPSIKKKSLPQISSLSLSSSIRALSYQF